jgi:hypothetical protein
VGEIGIFTLAIALSATFGLGGVLVGLFVGVRSISRDEERFGSVSLALDTTRADMSRLKIEWTNTLEQLEQLAGSVEKGRRRAAASLSAAERKEREQSSQEPEVPPLAELSPGEQRAVLRRQVRGLRGV